MNAQLNSIPETVTVTLTRDDIEAYAGESDDAHNELVSRITQLGPEQGAADIVRRALQIHGWSAREKRTVSMEHAGAGLIVAILRMNAALEYARSLNLDSEQNSETAYMVLEGGYNAAGVAMEIMNRLDLGSIKDDDTPSHEQCFAEWRDHMDFTGNYLTVDPADVPKAIYWGARIHFRLDDEQLAEFKAKVREHAEMKELAVKMILDDQRRESASAK